MCFSLVKEAAIHSKQSGERGLAARSVKKVTRVRACNQRNCLYGNVGADHILRRTLWVNSRVERRIDKPSSSHDTTPEPRM